MKQLGRNGGAAAMVLMIAACGGTTGGGSADGAKAPSGGGANAALVAKIDDIVNEPIKAGKVAGTSVAVIKGKDTLVLKGYGLADVELDVPTPPNASYEIGSVTKQFTGAAILQLAEQGKLSLDDDITKYFPKFPTQGNKITVRRLLDHTSGIKGYTEIPEFQLIGFQHLPPDTLIQIVSKKPFDFKTGEEQIYNNSAFFMAGLIIEKVSGKSYADYVKENLFDKAGMKNSYYCSERKVHKNHAHGYDTDSTGLLLKGYLDHTWPYAAGSLCSTAGDLAAWNLALHGGKVLSPAMYAELIKPAELNDGTKLRYGKGIALTDIGGRRAIHHGGGIPGFLSESEYYPDDSLVVVVLQNTGGPPNPAETARKIAEAVLGKKEPASAKFDGDLSQFAGTYTGVGRGRASEMKIAAEGGALMLAGNGGGPGAKPDKLFYVSGDTFMTDGSATLTFRRAGGKVTGMAFDAGYGHFSLTKK